jgi:hypothetical protein
MLAMRREAGFYVRNDPTGSNLYPGTLPLGSGAAA